MSYRITIEKFEQPRSSTYGDPPPGEYRPLLTQVVEQIDLKAMLCAINSIRPANGTANSVTVTGPSDVAVQFIIEAMRARQAQVEAKAARAAAKKEKRA